MGGEEYVSARYHSAQNRYGRLLFLLDMSTFGLRSMPGLILIGLGLIVLFPSAGFYPEFSEIYFFTVTTMLIRILTFMGTVVTSGGRVAIDFRAAFDLKELTGRVEKKPDQPVTENLISEVTQIKLTDLCCGYLAEHPVLSNVSAELVAGRTYALVGKSGSGKSTLSDVLLGLLPPQSGAIQITDHHYHQINMASLRKKVVLVEQQTRIFSDTVRENITFGFAASQQEVEQAVEASGLSDFIASLPNGLETRLDYQGANLSGGQRQRIGLARALVRNPDVLILDEATSALDSSTRDLILQHLRELFQDKILLFITHDHHLTQTVDEIWHIKQGKLGIEVITTVVDA
jgi:ATP-binding cassette subfamily B protein